jgi:hypothetical protein
MSDLKNSRRNFLKLMTTTAILPTLPIIASNGYTKSKSETVSDGNPENKKMDENDIKNSWYDGPASKSFEPVSLKGNKSISKLTTSLVSKNMVSAVHEAPKSSGIAWGIPFEISDSVTVLKNKPVATSVQSFSANWLVFLHTSDRIELSGTSDGFYKKPFKGIGYLNEHIADYIIVYEDKTEERVSIKERHQIGMFQQQWGENCINAVAHHKPAPVRQHHEQPIDYWGGSQTRTSMDDRGAWINWLWAWKNPHPDKKITGFLFEPNKKAAIVLSAVTAGQIHSNPLRWISRQKALYLLPEDVDFNDKLTDKGLLSQIQLDLGQVISATPHKKYPNKRWENTYNNRIPEMSFREIIIEYTAHPEATFHLVDGSQIPVSEVQKNTHRNTLRPIAPALKNVKIQVYEKGNSKPVPVKLHIHGESDEYLAPVNRHRLPNNAWFEDYSVDFVHQGSHICTYIPGETQVKLPLGKVFLEISKGFEIRPLRKVFSVTPQTSEIKIEIENVLPWRDKGWVSADTHVHFLSPHSALMEGSAEGVNIVNLLASQWGELMTNVGDFDGETTLGSKDTGGDGEYLVRVGTENRQHVLGHISLLGYNGQMILPMTTGGADESAIGDPIEILLTEWAKKCKSQNGIVVLPHFPDPRMENAAAIVSGNVDGVEMTSWESLYAGINPYSLTDWYRYLNCGYFVAAVGGTDKMSAGTAVGTVRTYARIDKEKKFTYEEWKNAVRNGNTFVTYGPLLTFSVDGKSMGEHIKMSANGGMVDVSWEVASVTVPVSKVELIMNGEVLNSSNVSSEKGNGSWNVKIEKSSWLALLVRGHYNDKPEIITAHSSPVMIDVKGSVQYSEADSLTILEQIEGAQAYLETIGTRTDEASYKRMRLILESTHRKIHNRMHQMGYYHRHNPLTDHPDHHEA